VRLRRGKQNRERFSASRDDPSDGGWRIREIRDSIERALAVVKLLHELNPLAVAAIARDQYNARIAARRCEESIIHERTRNAG
jgi:hypothetical protein